MIMNILLTFDYELYLGKKSGSVTNCLIKPTSSIIDILTKTQSKAIFFIDSTYLWKLSEVKELYSKANEDYIKIKNQISIMAENGHCIYLHIHPHWVDAKYNPKDNDWDLSNHTKFTFQNLSEDEKKLVFVSSLNALKDINDNLEQEMIGFRAGGLYIQPFSELKSFFEKYNIMYDFSVLPGFISNNKDFSFNFSQILSDNPYSFNNNVSIKEDGCFTEIPISSFKMNLAQKIINSFWYRFIMSDNDKTVMGDGKNSGNIIKTSGVNFKKYFHTNETYSIELINRYKSSLYTKMLNKEKYIHFISHPKLISEYNLIQFENWLKEIASKYFIETDFKKILSE
ncbi:MAG: hypothetical protein JEZ09_11975 [Salinivirgaceae bacterium]|nr:hypothetical protein [Salinivirgaceae bacterium]